MRPRVRGNAEGRDRPGSHPEARSTSPDRSDGQALRGVRRGRDGRNHRRIRQCSHRRRQALCSPTACRPRDMRRLDKVTFSCRHPCNRRRGNFYLNRAIQKCLPRKALARSANIGARKSPDAINCWKIDESIGRVPTLARDPGVGGRDAVACGVRRAFVVRRRVRRDSVRRRRRTVQGQTQGSLRQRYDRRLHRVRPGHLSDRRRPAVCKPGTPPTARSMLRGARTVRTHPTAGEGAVGPAQKHQAASTIEASACTSTSLFPASRPNLNPVSRQIRNAKSKLGGRFLWAICHA